MKCQSARSKIFVVVAMVASLASLGAAAQAMYKYTDANGKVIYSDRAPKPGEKAELIQSDKESNVVTLPKPQGTAAQREFVRKTNAIQRDKLRAKFALAVKQAEQRLETAKKALEEGREARPDEQRIVVRQGGNAVLRTPEYEERIKGLEDAVKRAEEALDTAREEQRRGAPD